MSHYVESHFFFNLALCQLIIPQWELLLVLHEFKKFSIQANEMEFNIGFLFMPFTKKGLMRVGGNSYDPHRYLPFSF